MLLAVLNVLKIVGIVLLAILGIILFIFLLLMFVPIRYRLNGRYDDKVKEGKVNISFLLHIISAKVLFENKKLNMIIKFLGIPVFKKDFLDLNKESKESYREEEKEEYSNKAYESKINNESERNKGDDFDSVDRSDIHDKSFTSDEDENQYIDVDKGIKDSSIDLNVSGEKIDNASDGQIINLDFDDKEVNEDNNLFDKLLNGYFDYILNGYFKLFNFVLFGFFKIFDFIISAVFAVVLLIFKGIDLLVSKEDNILSFLDEKANKLSERIETKREHYNESADRIKVISDKIKGFSFKLSSIKGKIHGLKFKIKSIIRKIERAKYKANLTKNRIKEYRELSKTKRFKKTFAFLKKEVKYLLKHIFPRKCKGFIKFGFEHPDKTGKTYGYIAILYGIFGKRLKKFDVIPDFEHKILEGKVDIKGHIRLIHALIVAIKILLNRNVWIIKKKFDKINSKYKSMEMDEGFYDFDDDLDAIS
ncbi:DUF2953 domain-containing protein [uncultured Eubacterium sp.]|uniref:DUF2953 domain-containing protein n=1 Tax=uncultured Eubacterium sp. TaxID=165185 RepID=UPI00259667ED|nr:DUF2953 domain-containing protein [uncultured Eubacterium sp.]